MSASTHMPADGDPLPGGDLSRRCGRTASGSRWRTHSYCWACEQTKRWSGSASISPTADENVRTHLRTVSRIGHSQAVSMWAWPVATTRCVPAPAGRAPARRRGGGARRRVGAPAATASSAPREHAPDAERGAGRAPGGCASPRRARRSRRAAPRRRGRPAPRRRGRRTYCGSSPAVASEPSGDGWNCGNDGLDAASTSTRERPRDRVHGHGLAARVEAVHGVAVGVADQALPAEPGPRPTPSEVEHRLDAVPPAARGVRPVLGHGAREAEPRRVPGLAPRSTDGERRQLVERRPGLDVERLAGGGDERQHPLGQLAGDPLLDQLGVVVHAANGTERHAGGPRAAPIESLRARCRGSLPTELQFAGAGRRPLVVAWRPRSPGCFPPTARRRLARRHV